MKPYHLCIDQLPDALRFHWYGDSALREAGALSLPLRATPVLLPAQFAIDLAPLRDEVKTGRLGDAAALAGAGEFLFLRELLAAADLATLCEALFLFLWNAAAPPTVLAKSFGAPPGGADPDRRLVRLWFASNRRHRDGGSPTASFSADDSSPELSYGQCSVFIPRSHNPGSTGTAWWRRWIRLEEDDSLSLRATQSLPRERFWSALAGQMATWWQPGERNVFVLLHGFNVSFEDAALRAAQLGYDLKLPGEMAFFSWPSRGGVKDYPADEATISASVTAIATFLEELGARSGAERIHLFVHSMGNRGFLAALERLAARGRPPLRLGQVFFCAPDEDVRVFAEKNALFPPEAENRTLLVSPDDKAVGASAWLHQHHRVGLVPPLPDYPGIETIEVSGFGILELGHGYFAESEAVVLDLREAIATRKRAGERERPQAADGHYRIEVATNND